VHFHGKAHGGIDGANAARFELGDDFRADLDDFVPGAVKFEIGDRARCAAQGLARHAHDEAHKRLGPGIMPQKLIALRFESGAPEVDQARIVGAAVER
jgi:hypothetical protein